MYATFYCTNYWLDSPDATERCSAEWADSVPAFHEDLPECPHCHGPSYLNELLEEVA